MSTRLQTDRIRSRRLELGLSERKLAAVTGLSQSVIRGIEDGITHKDLTLGDLDRLATALAVELTYLLAPEPDIGQRAETAGPVTHADHLEFQVASLGALLYDVQRLIPVESLAFTTGMSLDETHAVLDELDRRLRRCGLLVHRLGNSVKVWRINDAVPHALLQRTWRAHLARRGLDSGQVRLLHQARNGRRTKVLSTDQQVTAAELVNAGLLVRTRSGGTDLSEDVRYSLLLDCGAGAAEAREQS